MMTGVEQLCASLIYGAGLRLLARVDRLADRGLGATVKPVRELVRACRYTKKHGIFAIALAVALRERGLRVTFHTDPDPAPKRIERICYARASALGVNVRRAIGLPSLLKSVRPNQIAVVLYDSPQGAGHFSPLLGRPRGKLLLPYDDDGGLDQRTFTRRWRAPDVLRQCLIVAA